jgi:16S rRNA A1518/A1519 N6-dimethyltransferase RsmA/KsgA/DIM1 with predicted DNA glycosylase/AP lyase activity
VVRLRLLPTPTVQVSDPKALFDLIQRGYSARRKTLANNLKGLAGLNAERLTACLAELGHPPDVRAERLCLADWAKVLERLG